MLNVVVVSEPKHCYKPYKVKGYIRVGLVVRLPLRVNQKTEGILMRLQTGQILRVLHGCLAPVCTDRRPAALIITFHFRSTLRDNPEDDLYSISDGFGILNSSGVSNVTGIPCKF